MCQFGVCYDWEKCCWIFLMLHIPIALSAIGSLCARIDVWELKIAPFSKTYTVLYSKLYVLGEKNSIHSNILLKRSNSIKLEIWVQLFNFSTFLSWHPDSAVPPLVCFELENSKTWKLQNSEIQNYKTTKLQIYKTTELQNYETTELRNYRTTKLRNYRTTKLQNLNSSFKFNMYENIVENNLIEKFFK
jgi:hypothetical protein